MFFKIEDREILACILILLHLTKSSCESTMLNHLFPDCFGLKNGLSLATRPYDLVFSFYCFGGTKRATPLFCWTLPLLVFCDFPNLTTASPTLTSEFFALLLAFKNASDNRSHRNEQEREHGQEINTFSKGPENFTIDPFLPLILGSQQIVNKSRQVPCYLLIFLICK